ncbi:MAG: hypothetical protein C0503_01205 [Gemmatimonas sp.]|nr:hypothetical protein [Gemmatimonas sp.]
MIHSSVPSVAVSYMTVQLDSYSAMSAQALNNPQTKQGLKRVLLDLAGLYEKLREKGSAA